MVSPLLRIIDGPSATNHETAGRKVITDDHAGQRRGLRYLTIPGSWVRALPALAWQLGDLGRSSTDRDRPIVDTVSADARHLLPLVLGCLCAAEEVGRRSGGPLSDPSVQSTPYRNPMQNHPIGRGLLAVPGGAHGARGKVGPSTCCGAQGTTGQGEIGRGFLRPTQL
jgi:hypothetical protein